MSDVLKTSIDNLKRSTARLNKIADEASAIVLAVEAFLNKECNVGLETYVQVSSKLVDQERGEVELTILGYQRWNGKFRITVSVGIDDESNTTKPWAEWDRDTKLETVIKLPELIDKTAAAVDERVNAAAEATTTVAQVLLAIDRKGAK
jgi:hypothetical protein